MLGVVADQVQVVACLPSDQRGANERTGTGHPNYVVVVQLAR